MGFFKKIVMWSFPRAGKDIGDYSKKEQNSYLVGMTGQNLIYGLIATAISIFHTDILQVPAGALVFVMFTARMFDACNDPLMGIIADRTKSRWGKFRPYLKFAPSIIAVFTISPRRDDAVIFPVFIHGKLVENHSGHGACGLKGDLPVLD